MQTVGRSAAIRSRSVASSPCSTRRAIDAAKAPTPGSMTCVAAATSAACSLTRGCAPSRRNAATTEAMLAVPVGTIRTSIILGPRLELDTLVDLVERQAHAEATEFDHAVLEHALLERSGPGAGVQRHESAVLGDDEIM